MRSARRDDLAAGRPAFGADVDDVVGDLDHVEVVFDDDDRIAAVDEFVQHVEQQADVLEMEPRRRFVEDVERPREVAAQRRREVDLDLIDERFGERQKNAYGRNRKRVFREQLGSEPYSRLVYKVR